MTADEQSPEREPRTSSELQGVAAQALRRRLRRDHVPKEYGGQGGARWPGAHLPPGAGALRDRHRRVRRSVSGWSCRRSSRTAPRSRSSATSAPMLRGDAIWCQLFSEPGAGSDLAGLTTRAVRDGDDVDRRTVRRSGTSFAHVADCGILLARTDLDVPKHRGITYFLVDMTTPGVEVRPLRQITGVAHFNEMFLDRRAHPARERARRGERRLGRRPDHADARAHDHRRRRHGARVARLPRARRGTTSAPTTRSSASGSRRRTRASRSCKWLGERARAAAKAGKAIGPGELGREARASRSTSAKNGDLVLALEGADGDALRARTRSSTGSGSRCSSGSGASASAAAPSRCSATSSASASSDSRPRRAPTRPTRSRTSRRTPERDGFMRASLNPRIGG